MYETEKLVFNLESLYLWEIKTREKEDLLYTTVWEEQRQPLGSAGISSYLRKTQPLLAGRNVFGTFPWGAFWGVKRLLNSVPWTLLFPLPETLGCCREKRWLPWDTRWWITRSDSLVFAGHGDSTGLFFQVLSIEPLSSLAENGGILVQRSFQGQVGKPKTWKR